MSDNLSSGVGLVPDVMRSPRTVDLEITSRCNLRCLYCYYFDNKSVNYQDLQTEDWLRFFEELGRIAIMNVSLAGGEPFIREDLKELLKGIVNNRMRFNILSNGTLISDDIAEYIAATHRCDFVQVSLDSYSSEAHDVCRGKGSFKPAVQGIKTLQTHGISVAVRVTVHRHNVRDLDKIARFLLDDLGIYRFGINSAGLLGTCRSNASEVLLSKDDRQAAMSTLLRLSQEYNGRISALAGPLAEARRWRDMTASLKTGSPSSPNAGRLTGCGCPFSKLSVRSDGTIIPCSMLAHVELGLINRDSLLEIWHDSPALNRLRMRHSIPLKSFEFCKGCEYIPYCTGNCPGLAYSLTGEIDHPSPDACLRRFLAEGGEIP